MVIDILKVEIHQYHQYILTGEYKTKVGGYGCEKSQPPPSTEDKICEKFHEKIGQLSKSPEGEEIDDSYVKEFLTTPTESLLIPTKEIRFGRNFNQPQF